MQILFFVYNNITDIGVKLLHSYICAFFSLKSGKTKIGRVNDMNKKEIENIVSVLLEQYGYDEEKDDYLDIVAFTRSLGFNVINAEQPEEEDGFIVIRPDPTQDDDGFGDKIIVVNDKRSFEWKRFIIAHEFAHSMLHYQVGSLYLHRENKKGKSAEENEADYFAAALLMPRISFARNYKRLQKKGLPENPLLFQLASIYKVPFESVSRRVNEVCEMELIYG